MALTDLRETVFVFDLDDTLYQEADYHDSGLNEVCSWVASIYGKQIRAELFAKKAAGEKDLLAAVCKLAKLPLSVKTSLLWIYRLHKPSISLNKNTRNVLQKIEQEAKALVILTDGRSITQRNKLNALGLMHVPAYISEDFSSEKPSALRFKLIMQDFPATDYVYVGDNPVKDFIAPNALGWRTFCLLGNERNIHKQSIPNRIEIAPSMWISELSELFKEG